MMVTQRPLPGTLNSKSKWVSDRLLRSGYAYTNGGPGWAAFVRKSKYGNPHEPCNLTVVVKDESLQSTATFRYERAPDIHVTRYLRLNEEDGWVRLQNFEVLHEAEHYREIDFQSWNSTYKATGGSA